MPGTNLTREEARTRATLLTVDAYDIALDLSTAPEGGTFRSTTVVRFTATMAPGVSAQIFLDRYLGGDLATLIIPPTGTTA